MKKLLSLVGVVSLALILAVPAFSAPKPIEVYINGNKVTFNAGAPYLQNNSVLVPFRAVFESLGLEVLWDAKSGTITGTGSDLNLKLKVGSNRASINGIVKKLAAAPVVLADTTYLPLRFIGEATGGTVLWDPTSKSVRISTPPTKAQDEVDITALLNTMTDYFNEENVAGVESIAEPGSTFSDYVTTLESIFDSYNLKSTLNSINIISLEAHEAVVYTSETSLRISGPYLPDQQDQYIYTLVRNNNKWLISDVQLEDSFILLTYDQALKPAETSQSDTSAINSTLSNYYKFLNEENVNGVMSVMTSNGKESDTRDILSLQRLFSTYNLSYTQGVSNIFYYNGSEAAMYAEQKTKEKNESDIYEQGIIYVFSKSSNGTWTISQTYTVFDALSR